jgi:hypothetical protein
MCSNTAGNNLFFVQDGHCGNLQSRHPRAAWQQPQFRIESDREGMFTYQNYEDYAARANNNIARTCIRKPGSGAGCYSQELQKSRVILP